MRGAANTFRRVSAVIMAAVVFVLSSTGSLPVSFAAPGTLDLARARVISLYPGLQVGMEIYFVLPVNAQQIRPSDHIRFVLPNFDAVTAPTTLEGTYSGSPQFSVTNDIVDTTGIVVLPGTGLRFSGMSVNNPAEDKSTEVIIQISEDADGTVVRNQATVITTDSNYVTDVSATVETTLSSLNLSGFTAPGSFVTMVDDTAVVATTTSDGVGYFNFVLHAVVPGIHFYRIFSSDSSNRSTSQTTLNIFLRSSYLTTVGGVLLSPTINLNKAEISPGDTITINGSAKPGAQINLFLESPLQSFTANAAADGEWSFTFSSELTQTLNPGQYQVYSVAQDAVGNQSITSNTMTFTVKTADTDNPPPACNISQGDLNCDGVTNLVDFSILLFHWDTNHRVADINNDETVDLTDFSIMMYYFQF